MGYAGYDVKENWTVICKWIHYAGYTVILVVAYLLIRIENKTNRLAASMNQLSTILSIKLGNNDD